LSYITPAWGREESRGEEAASVKVPGRGPDLWSVDRLTGGRGPRKK